MASTKFKNDMTVTGTLTAASLAGDLTGNIVGTAQLTSYTVAGLPAASTNTRRLVYVSNGDTGSPCLAVSNGTNWLRIALGAAVSAT